VLILVFRAEFCAEVVQAKENRTAVMNNFFINGIVKADSLKNAFSIGFFEKKPKYC
jgi:hypothetical protein